MEHPPISKYLYGAAIWLLVGHSYDFGTYLAARLASVILGVLTCVLVYLIGRDFFGRGIGFASAIILSLLPPFLAHTQIAAIDAPLVFFVTLTMYLFMLAVKNGGRAYYLASALSFGLTLGTKFNGVLLLPVMALLFLLHRAGQVRAKDGKIDLETVRKNLSGLLPVLPAVAFIGIAALVFFGIWPWLWTDPIGHLQLSLNHWSSPIQEYFLGSKGLAPLYYYPVYFTVTLPLLLFLPLAAGIICVARSGDPFKAGILLWFALPFAYNFTGFIQDGVRYILMIYPAVAIHRHL
jgi:4-amino-4-deoxy-L-arabinose transferase-like glycosyltransferase